MIRVQLERPDAYNDQIARFCDLHLVTRTDQTPVNALGGRDSTAQQVTL